MMYQVKHLPHRGNWWVVVRILVYDGRSVGTFGAKSAQALYNYLAPHLNERRFFATVL